MTILSHLTATLSLHTSLFPLVYIDSFSGVFPRDVARNLI